MTEMEQDLEQGVFGGGLGTVLTGYNNVLGRLFQFYNSFADEITFTILGFFCTGE